MSYAGAVSILVVIGIFLGYFYGSILFAVVIGKVFAHKDVRNFESKNPGATNATRVLGNKLGFFVLVMDTFKAIIPTLIMWFIYWFALRHKGLEGYDSLTGQYYLYDKNFNPGILIYLAGLSAVIGHLFPVYFKFHGGKGIATFGGLLLIISPFLGATAGIVIIVCVLVTRYVSLGAIIAVLIVPVLILIPGIDYTYLIYPDITKLVDVHTLATHTLINLPIMFSLYLVALLIVYRHKENIKNLRNGTERKFSSKNRIKVFNKNKPQPLEKSEEVIKH